MFYPTLIRTSDAENAERLYRRLTDRGLKVWYDQVSLQPGVPWEEGFCEGMMKSRSFVPLLSRRALANVENLHEGSSCDNVLLEYRLAQELRVSGFIEKIYPVMIGDREEVLPESTGDELVDRSRLDQTSHITISHKLSTLTHIPLKPVSQTLLSHPSLINPSPTHPSPTHPSLTHLSLTHLSLTHPSLTHISHPLVRSIDHHCIGHCLGNPR